MLGLIAGLWMLAQTPIVNPPPVPDWTALVKQAAVSSYMVTAGIDYGVTMYALGKGYVEANPVLRPLSDHPVWFGVVKLGAAAAVSWYLLKQDPQRWKHVLIVAGVMTALNTAFIIHNQRVLRR